MQKSKLSPMLEYQESSSSSRTADGGPCAAPMEAFALRPNPPPHLDP